MAIVLTIGIIASFNTTFVLIISGAAVVAEPEKEAVYATKLDASLSRLQL